MYKYDISVFAWYGCLYDVLNCIKNIQNVSNEHASNIASIKELCKIRDKVVFSKLSLLEANTLIELICTNKLTTIRNYSSIVYSLYDMSLYIFEGRILYFNCVFIYSTLHDKLFLVYYC